MSSLLINVIPSSWTLVQKAFLLGLLSQSLVSSARVSLKAGGRECSMLLCRRACKQLKSFAEGPAQERLIL